MKELSYLETSQAVENSLQKLAFWLKKNGLYGYDPYDIRGCSLNIHLSTSPGLFAKLLKKSIKYGDIFCPSLLRRTLNIKKEKNAKAMGLFASSYLDLYKTTHLSEYLSLAKELLNWLEQNVSSGYCGSCWGYPFDWQWLHFIPRGTPSAVVTSIVGDAFLTFYHFTRERKYLDVCKSICEFFLNDLNIDYIDSNKICFSYTPLDRTHVLNANLFAAEFLIRIGKTTKNKKFMKHGSYALNYTLDEQNKDGSFYYFGRKDRKIYQLPFEIATKIDHYHTGFMLRSLYAIYHTTKNKRLCTRIKHCLHHYLENLFEEKTIPKMTPENTYPVNIHGCAEAILCLSTLLKDFPEVAETLINTTLWTIREMQTNEGWFMYMIKKRIGLRWKIRIPFIRWGQAWMLRALSSYCLLAPEE